MIYTASKNSTVVESTGNNYTNFGKIMYESEVNNMAIFEAVLACDFHEVKGLNEGTILKSEISALNEGNIKNMIEKIKEAMIRVRDKLLDLLERFIDYVGNYIVKDGAALAKRWREEYQAKYANWDKSGFVGDLRLNTINEDEVKKYTITGLDIDLLSNIPNANENVDSVSILTKELSDRIGTTVESGNHFKELVMSRIHKEVSPNKDILEDMCKTLESKNIIKTLKDEEGAIRRAFDSAIKGLSDQGSTELSAKAIEAYSSAYQTIIQIFANLNIKIHKERLRLAHRGVMTTIAAIDNSMKEKGLKESAVEIEFAKVLAESTFDELMEDLPGVNPVDPENKDAVDVLKASCEEKPAVTED